MRSTRLVRGVAVGVTGALAPLTLSAPAWGLVGAWPDPGPAYPSQQHCAAAEPVGAGASGTPVPVDSGETWDPTAVASGALGGVLVAGAVAAASRRLRRREPHGGGLQESSPPRMRDAEVLWL
jgi:hypothetical protein